MGLHHHIPGLARKAKENVYRRALNYDARVNPAQTGKFMEHGGERNIDNLWTGYHRNAYGKQATATLGIGATLGLAAIAAPRAAEARTDSAVQQQAEEGGVESLMSTRGDEIGYSVNLRSLSDLQSQGDLVFALNRLRN